MPTDEQFDRAYRATVPTDAADPPRFGQALETTKDAIVLSLREFFGEAQPEGRFSELPTIEKYQAGLEAGLDPFLTTVEIVQEFPDILEQLPHLSVTASGGRNTRMTIGVPFLAHVQYPPRVEGRGQGPYDLSSAMTLRYRTQPHRRGTWVASQFVLRPSLFTTPSAVTPAEVVEVLKRQGLYAQPFVTESGTLGIQCGGLNGGDVRPNTLEVLATSDTAALSTFGFDAGQTAVNFPPRNRYHTSTAVDVNIDILSVGVNTRRELADLVYGWATFWLERRNFELQGRSWTSEDVSPEEWYHIVVHQEVTVGAFQATDRVSNSKDKIQVQRVTIPVTAFMYIDRVARFSDGSGRVLGSTERDETLIQPT